MAVKRVPPGLSAGGRALWLGIAKAHDLDPVQQVNLLEACRQKDRLDKLDELLRGDVDVWVKLTHRLKTEDYELKVDDALMKANATANQMKQHLAALRLPDALGERPQKRGGARGGVYAPRETSDAEDRTEVTDIRSRLNGIA